MNRLQFTSSLISSLAWPLVVIVLAVVFRKQISDLLARIRSFKGPGAEAVFGDRLADAENFVAEAARSTAGDKKNAQWLKIEPNPLALEADSNPSFVVIRAWEQVLLAINDLADKTLPGGHKEGEARVRWFIIDIGGSRGPIDRLQKADLISPETAKAIAELRDLRNKVAHGEHNPTPGEAIAYAEAAQRLSAIMNARAEIEAPLVRM